MGEAIKAPDKMSRGRSFCCTSVSGLQTTILTTEAVNLNFNLSFGLVRRRG